MPAHSAAFDELWGCFRGTPPKRGEWTPLIALANETLTTPALIDLIDQCEQDIPEDVCRYVRHIFDCNLRRNDRLADQLAEAVVAMNEEGVTPILFKGAAVLATSPRSRCGTRLMSDLDILVPPDKAEAARAAMAGLGYEMHFQAPVGSENWYADMKRPQDVGMIDLHWGAPGPAYFYRASGPVEKHCRSVSVGRGSAYIPTSTYQALMLIVHDQFQDYDYWTGAIDGRHLLELRDLTNLPEGIDWDQLASFAPSKLARNAIESQLVALAALLGVDVPARMRSRIIPRLQFGRRLAQARFPIMRWPLLATAALDYANYRKASKVERTQAATAPGRSWPLPRLGTMRFILRVAATDRPGKI